ncbi:MAG: hypothetical protein IT381_23515 [Deltaproteobacteria bacterium]|nr:hypothetical protein [Deltaproteobacteria bacterium]
MCRELNYVLYDPIQVTDCQTIAWKAATGATGTTGTTGATCSATLNVTGKYTSQERNANDGKDYTQPVNLSQNGSDVVGWYRGTQGSLGTFDGKLAGCVLTGTWHQDGSASGPYQFVFSGAGESFTGGWDYSGSTTPQKWSWTGTRTGTTPDDRPTTSGGGCTANVDCGTCYRCELSTGKCLAKLVCR